MAEPEAQCSQETDKMLGGNHSDDDDDSEAQECARPMRLSHAIANC